MNVDLWFSTKLRYAVLAEFHALKFYMDSIRLLRADSYEQAFRRALEFGKAGEQKYRNSDGETIVWKLASVISLDMIGAVIEDNQEVYSGPVEVSGVCVEPFDREFHPENSQPTQTR